ncbi:hypothetical protein CCHL11_02461 [Colletotrichum chlorophyti]|uniref:Uncharacterized protein n=1 Tax=Colletotrichum chlorophyti TaxID=708187 RepID=A0A1Q8S638_9PEZI|nr:hypothetical protein CCHL11_02461 [Colletotrichum chlorophyti]
MASLSALGLNLRLADIDENLKSHPSALSWPISSLGPSAVSMYHDFIDDVPCFAYTEVFESGDIFQAVSPGSGIYLPSHSSPCSLPAFSVSKCRLSKTIEIEIQSPTLLQSLAVSMPSGFDFFSLLSNYAALKAHLEHLETISPSHPSTAELRLLVRHLLLERALYAGIGTEVYRSKGFLSLGQLQDMHQRSVDAGLDDLDACFSLGLLPDVLDDAFVEALSVKFTELALAGDLAALHDLCEPVVRSGEIEWQTSPNLLIELLDRGWLDVFRYVLDLASRTRDAPPTPNASFLRDITHEPLHVAIRLGHVEQVRSLLQQGADFMGVYRGDEVEVSTEQVVLTPLSAAAFWGQPEIVRLVLQHNLVAEGLREAVVIAMTNNNVEIMQILFASGLLGAPLPIITDDAVESHATFRLGEQQTSGGPSAAAMPNPHNTAIHFEADLEVFGDMRDKPSGGTHQQPNATPPKAPVRRKVSRHRRRLIGQDLVSCMNALCSQLRTVCNCATQVKLQEFANDYLSPSGVWDRGICRFRALMQDSPPLTLLEVTDSLLISNAICLSLFKDDDSLFLQFVNDLDRWRSVLPADSQLLFDSLAFGMWAFTPSGDDNFDLDQDGIRYFQELVNDLVSSERQKASAPSRMPSAGSRLAAVQRAFEEQNSHQSAGPQVISPSRSQPRHIADVASSAQRDDLVWAEFLHMERFDDLSSKRHSAHSSTTAMGWEDVLSSSVLLLASVAFSIVLVLILGLHSGSPEAPIHAVTTTRPGYLRSSTLLTDYLATHGISTIPPLRRQAEASSVTSQSSAYGSESCLSPSSSFSSLSTLGLRRGLSSSSFRKRRRSNPIATALSRPQTPGKQATLLNSTMHQDVFEREQPQQAPPRRVCVQPGEEARVSVQE